VGCGTGGRGWLRRNCWLGDGAPRVQRGGGCISSQLCSRPPLWCWRSLRSSQHRLRASDAEVSAHLLLLIITPLILPHAQGLFEDPTILFVGDVEVVEVGGLAQTKLHSAGLEVL